MLTESFHGFPQSLKADPGTVLRAGHDSLLRNPFQFLIHQSPYSSTLYSLGTDSDVRVNNLKETGGAGNLLWSILWSRQYLLYTTLQDRMDD
jgi:hypothetical protein